MIKIERCLKELISIKTISGHCKENKEALDWIKKKIKNLPVYIKEFKSNSFSSLIITTQKTKTPIVCFVAHIDVVPGPNEIFIPKRRGNIIYGRGAFDMKFAIVCYIKLLVEINKDLSRYNFGILITSDEEIGGYNGTNTVLNYGFNPKVCLLPDAGSNWKYESGAKSSWRLSIQSKGKTAHGSKPWQGKSAVEKLIEFLFFLRKEFPIEPCGISNHYHNSINIGKIQGGEIGNSVADFAEALIDIRLKPEIDKKDIKRRMEFIKKKYRNIIIKEITFKRGYKANLNSYYFDLFSSIAYKKFKINISYKFSHGTSDAYFFNKKKIPVILIQPKGGGHHTNKEWIDIKDLERFYSVLRYFTEAAAKK